MKQERMDTSKTIIHDTDVRPKVIYTSEPKMASSDIKLRNNDESE